ncbi:hypothetical protein B7463_g11617, partial [Scytalidium lignicola]
MSPYYHDDYDSNDGDNTHKLDPWVAAVIGMAGVLAIAAIFVAIVKFFAYRSLKREYKQILESEPGLEWKVFRERCKERARRNAQLADEEEDRELAEAMAARRARREERRNKKLHDKQRKNMARGKGRSSADETVLLEEREAPPYSAAVDPEGEVGMKPW